MTTIKKILVPIDFSDYSINALKYSVGFAKHFKAKMFLIYVVEPVIYPADFSMGQVSIPSLDVDITEKARKELTTLAKKEIGRGVDVEIIIKVGKPFLEINQTASEKD